MVVGKLVTVAKGTGVGVVAGRLVGVTEARVVGVVRRSGTTAVAAAAGLVSGTAGAGTVVGSAAVGVAMGLTRGETKASAGRPTGVAPGARLPIGSMMLGGDLNGGVTMRAH